MRIKLHKFYHEKKERKQRKSWFDLNINERKNQNLENIHEITFTYILTFIFKNYFVFFVLCITFGYLAVEFKFNFIIRILGD